VAQRLWRRGAVRRWRAAAGTGEQRPLRDSSSGGIVLATLCAFLSLVTFATTSGASGMPAAVLWIRAAACRRLAGAAPVALADPVVADKQRICSLRHPVACACCFSSPAHVFCLRTDERAALGGIIFELPGT